MNLISYAVERGSEESATHRPGHVTALEKVFTHNLNEANQVRVAEARVAEDPKAVAAVRLSGGRGLSDRNQQRCKKKRGVLTLPFPFRR